MCVWADPEFFGIGWIVHARFRGRDVEYRGGQSLWRD